MTPTCPPELYEIVVDCEGVELICHLEYEPEEIGSTDSEGLPNEPDYLETMNLINAYCNGVDIAHLLMQSLVDNICESALEQLEKDQNDC
jgi:hypothetical protein